MSWGQLQIARRVAPGPSGAGEARRALVGLESKMPAISYAAVRLLVSEIVANVRRRPRQGPESVGLRVAHGPAGVRVELTDVVADTAPGQAPREAVGWDASLLDELSDRWGIIEGTTSDVWFEIDAVD